MPYSIKKVNGKYEIIKKATGKLAVKKKYSSKSEADRVSRLREYYSKKGE